MATLNKKLPYIYAVVYILLSFLAITPALANTSDEDPYGIYYRHARIFGKIMHYEPERDLCTVYGSVFVREPYGNWRTLGTKKFLTVQPQNQTVRDTFKDSQDETIITEGALNLWPGQKEEVLLAQTAELVQYDIDIPDWYGFGKTIKTEQIYEFNLSTVSDFVDILANLAQYTDVSQNKRLTTEQISEITQLITNPRPDQYQLYEKIKDEFQANWDIKWCVAKDTQAANQLRSGVGGFQIYKGHLSHNCYIKEAPVIRKNLDTFMDTVTAGGDTPEEEGSAVMYAKIHVTRDKDKKGKEIITRVTASGALYDTLPNFYNALKDPSDLNLETWELKGWSEKDIELMEGNYCWLSGNRVLIYKDSTITGKPILVEQYYTLNNYLTQDGFNNILDVANKAITQGGI